MCREGGKRAGAPPRGSHIDKAWLWSWLQVTQCLQPLIMGPRKVGA